jgi:2'-5' RNA ligase
MCGMRLFAAIVPPREVLQELSAVLGSVRVEQPSPEGGRRFLRRPKRGAHAAGRVPVASTSTDELVRPEIDHLHLRITSFGNVTLGDSVKLADALRQEAVTWRRPEVHFAGAKALEFPGDESVWAVLEGDVDQLRAIGRNVPQVVQRLGFFVDRRVFRPWLPVATITEQTTAPYLERVVDALDRFHGASWTVDSVFLMKRTPDAGADEFEVMEEMPLAPR